MILSIPDSSKEEKREDVSPKNSLEYGYIRFRELEYRKGLRKGDMVFIEIQMMEGGEYGRVLSNDETRVKVQLTGYAKSGRPLYRSFWVKNGLSCGPAIARAGWGSDWLFYYLVTPTSFGAKIMQIIDLAPADFEILSTRILDPEDEVPF